MNIRHITPDRYLRQPWKNGGGTTTELLKEVVDGEVLWRLSIAAVEQSGPFSDFSGFDRTIMLLKGNGMVLSFDGAADGSAEKRIDRCYVPFEFAGEWKTDCRLIDGPVEDFNFMVDGRRAGGRLQARELGEAATSHTMTGNIEVLHGLRGVAEVLIGETRVVLQATETLRIDRRADEMAASSIALRALVLPCSLAFVCINGF